MEIKRKNCRCCYLFFHQFTHFSTLDSQASQPKPQERQSLVRSLWKKLTYKIIKINNDKSLRINIFWYSKSKEYQKALKPKRIVLSWTRKKFEKIENFIKGFLNFLKYFDNVNKQKIWKNNF